MSRPPPKRSPSGPRSTRALPRQARPWLPSLAFLGGIFTLLLFVYSPALHGPYIFDDHWLIQQNPHMADAAGLFRMWLHPTSVPDYYPLTYTTWWLELNLFGSKSLSISHVLNVLLHALNALLIWRILRRLRAPGALAVALIFALHPLQVESVAWLSERKNVLSGAFYFASILAFICAVRPSSTSTAPAQFPPPAHRIPQPSLYFLSLAFFAAALLSKPVTLTLSAALPLVLWRMHGRLTLRYLAAVIPFVLLAIPMAVLTIWLQAHHVHAHGPEYDLAPLQRIALAANAACFYIWKTLWPARLSFAYPRWSLDITNWLVWIAPVALAAVAAALVLLRRRLGFGLSLAFTFFLLTILPALGFVNIYWHKYYYVADHNAYLAMLGIIVPISAAAAITLHHLVNSPRARLAFASALLLSISAALGLKSWSHARLFQSELTLWHDVLKKDSRSALALTSLGQLSQELGRTDDAIRFLQRALDLRPADPQTTYNLAYSIQSDGDIPRATSLYRRAIDIVSAIPSNQRTPDQTAVLADASVNLGALSLKARRDADAEALFLQAVHAQPRHAMAWHQLGLIRAGQNNWDDARCAFEITTQESPAFADAWVNLGVALARTGRTSEAIAALTRGRDLAHGDLRSTADQFLKSLVGH